MKITLRIISLIGIIIFGSSFIFTYSTPGYVEEIGKEFIKNKIEEKTNEKIEKLTLNKSNNILIKLASKLAEKNQEKITKLKEQLKSKAHIKLAAVIAEMRNLSCECRKKHEKTLEEGTKSSILSMENANVVLVDFMKTKYMEVANKLKTDFRIFTGNNTLVFFILLLISFLKPRAITHLILPAALLTLATVICSYFYIFEQNWFFTIIYNTYLGWSYLAYLGIVFAFLCDIVFNKARVTTEIINAILNAIGNAVSVAPC